LREKVETHTRLDLHLDFSRPRLDFSLPFSKVETGSRKVEMKVERGSTKSRERVEKGSRRVEVEVETQKSGTVEKHPRQKQLLFYELRISLPFFLSCCWMITTLLKSGS